MNGLSTPPDQSLLTPIYLKTRPDMAWPTDVPVFYLLTGDGLFLCRNHPFFTSSVSAPAWPRELADHRDFLEPRFPKIPRHYVELIVGFFDIVGRRHNAEAAVLLAWDERYQRVRLIVPVQRATVGHSWYGNDYPIDVHYQLPVLPPGLTLIGDFHSHVDGPAYASMTDCDDERHFAGLHVVVGRLLSREPPDFHIEAIVDGARFPISDPETVSEGYQQRRSRVPASWLEKVKVEQWSSVTSGKARVYTHEKQPPYKTTPTPS